MYILSYGSSYDFIILWLSDSYVDIIYIYYHIIMNFAGKTYLDVWEVRRCSDGSGSEKLEIGFVDAQVCRVMTRFFFLIGTWNSSTKKDVFVQRSISNFFLT